MLKTLGAILLILLLLAAPAAAASVRLVLMDGINLEHLAPREYGNLHYIVTNGALGLANVNTAGSQSRENAVLTLASGSRALGPGAGGVYPKEAELETGTAAAVHARCTGVSAPPGSLVMPGIALIVDANAQLLHQVRPFYLGLSLAEAGKTVAALVNGDKEGNYREGAALAADPDGVVPGGSVATGLIDDSFAPFGQFSRLADFVLAAEEYREADFLVIDLGDTSRAQDYLPFVVQEKREGFRRRALARLDELLGELLLLQEEDDLLLVVGLRADRTLADEEGKMLAPILAYGQGFHGLLTSATTRRPGVVANIDVAPTVLDFFALYEPGEVYGQPLTSTAHPDPLAYLLGREREMASVYKMRSYVVKGFIALIVALVAAGAGAFFLKWRRLGWLKIGLLAAVATPLVLLVLAPLAGSLWLIPAWLVLALALSFALKRLEPKKALSLLGALTALAVLADALLGAPLEQRSILGYDAIAGARYYGIGNEYMGVLLGSSLLALGEYLSRKPVLAGLALAPIVLALMLPGVGANLGGALAALVGFTVALTGSTLVSAKKNRPYVLAALAVAVLIFVLVNLGSGQSHVGRFFLAVAEDPGEFWRVISRKLAMNWRLIRWSQWSKAFAAMLAAALGLFLTRRRPLSQRLGRSWPQVRGAMAAALAALALNDSGIVAAATALLYLTLPLLYCWFSSNSFAAASHSR